MSKFKLPNRFRKSLKQEFKQQEDVLDNLTNKFGVYGIFHFADGGTSTLRAFSDLEGATDAAKQVNKEDALSYLCWEAKNDNLVNNEKAAGILLAYGYHSNTYQLNKQFTNLFSDTGEVGLIMNFFIKGNEFACRDCQLLGFNKWYPMTRDMQLEGHTNEYYEEALNVSQTNSLFK